MLRQRIPLETGQLGPWPRLPVRRGRRVTQEEIAEAIGVSRSWYRMLETRVADREVKRFARAFEGHAASVETAGVNGDPLDTLLHKSAAFQRSRHKLIVTLLKFRRTARESDRSEISKHT